VVMDPDNFLTSWPFPYPSVVVSMRLSVPDDALAAEVS